MLVACKLHFADFCYPVDDIGCFLAKEALNINNLNIGILNSIVKESGHNTDYIHFHLGENICCF